MPLMTAFVDPSAVPPLSWPGHHRGWRSSFEQLKDAGLNRLDYRWGFDDDALMSITRLVAPAPRKTLFAMFDQPKLDTKQLIPMPEGVDSFVLMSVSPAKVLDAVAQVGPPGEAKAKIDEFMGKLKEQSRIDFEKDFLGNLGPKMAIYLAPGRSAATTDETPEAAVKAGGLDPMAMLSSLGSALPKPTLVAELSNPTAFGKALDAVMITVNKELKAKAIEQAAADEEAGAGRGPPGCRARGWPWARDGFQGDGRAGPAVRARGAAGPQAQPQGNPGAGVPAHDGLGRSEVVQVDRPRRIGPEDSALRASTRRSGWRTSTLRSPPRPRRRGWRST